jgi:hypothetical protein
MIKSLNGSPGPANLGLELFLFFFGQQKKQIATFLPLSFLT